MLATLRHWIRGIRLYLGFAIALISIEVLWWARVVYGDTQLETIRLQETYAWLSVGLLALTLLIGPVTKVWPRTAGLSMLRDARRMIGIGAAWFALLHAAIAYFGQFKGSNPLDLPLLYQQSLLLGIIGLVVLLALSFTSFNAAMKRMGIWWFRLHRLIYLVVVTALVHAFMIGVHATETTALLTLGGLAIIICTLKLFAWLRRRKQT